MKKLFTIKLIFITTLVLNLSACRKHDVIDNRNNNNNTMPAPPCDQASRAKVTLRLTEIGRLSLARTPASATLANKIVFAGGVYEYSQGSSPEPTAVVDVYDIDRRDWSTAQLSAARENIAAVACGNKIFFAGGDNKETVYDNVDVYDVTNNSWSLMHLSEARTCISAKAFGTKVFFAGGTRDMFFGTTTIDIYDLATSTWSTAQLSQPKFNLSIVEDGDKILFAGGGDFMQYYSGVDIYDNGSGTWSTSKLENNYCGIFVATIKGNTYWVYWGQSDYSINLSVKNLSTGSSIDSCLPQYPQGSIYTNDEIVFFDGNWNDFGGFSNDVDIYNPETGQWSKAVFPGADSKPINVNGTLYVGGGYNYDAGVFEDKVYKVSW